MSVCEKKFHRETMRNKVTTDKYVVYCQGGQIYNKDGSYLRPISEEMAEYVAYGSWAGKKGKEALDELIENNFDGVEPVKEGLTLKEAMSKIDIKDIAPSRDCQHSFRYLERDMRGKFTGQYIFYCIRCLKIVKIEDERVEH